MKYTRRFCVNCQNLGKAVYSVFLREAQKKLVLKAFSYYTCVDGKIKEYS